MKHTMQYSVGDEVAHVPSNEADEFNSVAKSQNITPEPIFTYRVSNKSGDVQQLDVPKAEYEEFAKTAADNGYKIEPLRLMTMEDGTERFFSARELRAFTRSDEYLNSPDGVEAKRRQEEANAEMARMEAERPGFLSELGRNMFTAGGIREVAEDSAWARPYAYANDLANALVGGLLKGSAKIEQGIGHLVGSDWLVNDAKGGQALVERNLPTDMLDTKKPGAVNKVLDVGKGVAEVSGEFAPSMIPGVGQAYAASLVGAGSTIRYMQVYDDAIAHGCEPERAIALASLGATVDAGQNMLLMGKFKGIWKGEQAQLAQAAKEGLVRRLTKDTLKTGAIMSGGGMSQDVIDQAAEGAYWLDVGRTAKVGFDQFIEGGLFHLVNTGAHNATRIKWGDEAKGIPAGAARDMMEAPEGRALVFSNSPEAAQKIYMARRRGENVSRKMIEDLGLSGDTSRTVADRNAIGDRLVEDYLAFKERVRTKMDDVQAASLADEIASRSDEGVNNPAFEKVWFKAVEQIKDARELDDPERRKQIVDEAVKTTETKGERLQRQRAVAKYNRERAAEDAERRAEAEKAAAGEQKPMKVELYDVNGKRIEPVSAAEEPVKAPEEAMESPETPAETTKTTSEAPVEVPKTPDARESAENPPPTASAEAGTNKETPVAPSAPSPVLARPAASATAEKPAEPETRIGIVERTARGNAAGLVDSPSASMSAIVPEEAYGAIRQLDREHDIVKVLGRIATNKSGTVYIDVAERVGGNIIGKRYFIDTHRGTHELQGGSVDHTEEWRSSGYLDELDNTNHAGSGKEAPKTAPDVPKTAEVVSKTETAAPEASSESGARYSEWSDKMLNERLARLKMSRASITEKNKNRTASKNVIDREISAIEAEIAKRNPPESGSVASADMNDAKKSTKTTENPAEKPAGGADTQKNGTNSRSLSDAVRELMAAKDDLRSVERPTWTDKDTAEDKQKYHDEIIAPREKRISELEAEIDSKRAPATDFADFYGKPDPKKAAKVLADFTYKQDKKEVSKKIHDDLSRVYHDKKAGLAVASDGRILIASKHGFDPNADNGDVAFPNWRHIVGPTDTNSKLAAKVNPTELAKVCKTISSLAKATDGEGEHGPLVAINFGGNHVSYFSASQLAKVAKAMEANGITELRTSEEFNHPAIASNGDTSIVIMPYHISDIETSGRGDWSHFIVNGHNGRIITAPERTDTGYQYGHERLDQLKADYESYRARNVKTAKDTNLYKLIVEARKKGVSDPKAIYDGGKLNNKFDQLKPELKEDFAKWVNAESDEKTAELIAEYMMENDKYPSNKKERLREIAKIEKRIGAEDEIEGLIMRSDEARRFLGTDKPKAEAKPVEEKKAADEKPVAEDKPVEPTNGGEDPADEPSRTKESVRLGFEISDLIFKHLKAQATAKNNASGRKLKDEAKAALVNRISSLTDAEYADVKGRLKEIMSDAGLDPKKSGYVQAIFNAETAKRNAAKRNAAKPKQEPKAELSSVYENEAVKSAYDKIVDANIDLEAAKKKPNNTMEQVAIAKRRDAARKELAAALKDIDTAALEKSKDEILGGITPEEVKKKGYLALLGRNSTDMIHAIEKELKAREAEPAKAEQKKLSLADAIAERVKSVEKEDWTAADKATDAIREAMESATDEELASAYKDAASKSTNVHRGIASELKHEIEGRGKTVRDTSELDSYLAGKKPMEAARIRKTLEKRIDFGGDVGVTTEAELVDKAVKGGKSVVTAEVTTSKSGKPKVNFLMDGNFITATAANYAKARGVKTDENSLARASEHLTLYAAVDAYEARMKSKGFTGGKIESYTSDKDIENLLLQRKFSNPLIPADNVLANALREVKEARIKRGDWNPGSVLGKEAKPAEPEAPKAKPGKFTDSVYETYRSELSFRDGAKIFAEDALDTARAKLDERIEKAEKAMEDSRGDNGTYKDEAAFDENAELVETLKGKRKELNEIGERIKHGFDDRAPKGETHAWLREVLSDINSVEKIDDYEDIGDFVSRRGEKRTGIKSIDKFNDKWYDEIDGRADPSTIDYGIETSWTEADRRIADYARTYLEEDISFDKDVYDKLSDAEKRAFDKLVDKLDDAKDMALNTDSTIEDARRYVEAHEAIRTYEESAKKYQSLMRDKDGRPVLFTDKGRADEMARDAAGGMVRAIGSGDKSAAGSAESALRLSVENGAEIPSKADVEKMAAELPEAKREAFVKYMDGWREYAKSMKDKPSIADEASKLADEVDAAIAAEEAEGTSGRPDAAPSGRGTGALPQDEPLPQGTTTTGKMRGIVTPQSFLKEARRLFPDVAIRGKGTMRMSKWAAGHFEGAYRVIRSRDMNAIRTITHELGHELEYLTRYDLPRTPAAKRDLSDLGHQLYPSGPGMPKPNSYIGEGFAEYIRGYICNAQNLHQVAPDMDAWFRGNFKAKHPEIVKKIDRLRDMVQTMKEQSAADTLRGFRHPATTVVERAWKKVTEFASSENWNDSASTILKGMKKSGIDKLFHWQDEFRELEAAVKAGDTVRAQRLAASVSDKIANHPYLFPTITRGTASQRVMDMARHGTTSLLGNVKTGESLKEIFADFSHKEQEAWKDYAVARHGLENYYAKGLEFGMPKDVLEEVVRQYDSPKFQQALQRVTDYSHRILHLGVDSGLISQETYDSIVKNHPIYVRITRRKAEDGAGTKQGGAAINKRTGGFENILDPIDAMLMDQEKFLRACFQARSMQLIVGAANRAKLANLKSIRDNGGPNTSTVNPANQSHIAVGAYWPIEVPNAQEKVTFAAGKLKQGLKEAADDYSARTGEDAIPIHEFINDLATYTDPMGNASMLSIFRDKPSNGKHNLVSVYVDGKLHTYELPDMKWANMLTDVYDKSDFNWAERTFGLATAGIRLGATTINPGFAIRNGIRDSLHSAVMSESGAIPMLGTLNGMLNQLTGKEAAQMFRSMGGHMSDLVGVTKEQKWEHGGKVALAQNKLQLMKSYGWDWLLMKPVIKATSDILSYPELGPRVREFNGILQKCRAAGLTEDVSAMLAMSHAKDISIDFQRAGRYMKHINHFIPFSNAMWRGTEQTVRNLGLLNALPHQFEDRNLQRGMKTVGKGLAYITSWAATLAMLEMSGDEEYRRQAFEREPKEKWEYEHVGDWRIPLPFEMGYIFGALPKAAVYEMYGDKGAIKECLKSFSQAIPSKYLDPEIALGSVSLFTPIIGLLKNEDYRGRAIVPDHIKENRVKEDWYTQYTTELSKKIGGAIGESPAQIEYLLDSYTGGLYRRTALAVENIGDTSRLQQGRGFSMLDTLRARPQANRLVGDFYKFGEEAKQKLGSGKISLEEYGKFASMNGTKEELTAKFNAMREIRADKSIPLAEQDERVNEIAKEVNDAIRDFNARDDYRQRGIAYAASHLTGSTLESLDDETRRQYTDLLKDVPTGEIVQALIRFGNETILVKQKGVKVPHQRWSNKNINERVNRLLMIMQRR